MDLATYIRDIPDWPKEGVMFKDITPLLASPEALRATIDTLADAFADAGVTKVMGAEARGFIFGGALAYRLGAGFVPARKPGSTRPRRSCTHARSERSSASTGVS